MLTFKNHGGGADRTYNAIGKMVWLDFAGFEAFIRAMSYQERDAISDAIRNQGKLSDMRFSGQWGHTDRGFRTTAETNKARWDECKDETLLRLHADVEYSATHSIEWLVYEYTEAYAWVSCGQGANTYVIFSPGQWLKYSPNSEKDYSNYTLAQMRQLAGSGGTDALMVPNSLDNLTVNDLKESMATAAESLSALADELKAVEDGTCDALEAEQKALADIQARLEAKKASLMAELEKRQADMMAMANGIKKQIAILEAGIYCIRCYLNDDVITFCRIRDGRQAPMTEPIILHQKIRFLDVEMGKLVSIYGVDGADVTSFEKFLAASPLALETFCPNERCITLAKVSETGRCFAPSNEAMGMLKEFEKYHGNTLAIIIRNGEQVFVGYCDEDRIHLSVDDFVLPFAGDKIIESDYDANESDWDRERRLAREASEAQANARNVLSRVFIFNILQGVVDNTELLPLPEGIKLTKISPYVQYSVADHWLVDRRFGTMSDIVERCNASIKEGDSILTTAYLSTGRTGERMWSNVRGRGEANRTHDCVIRDCSIYPINLIEFDPPKVVTEYKHCGHMYKVEGEHHLSKECEITRVYDYSRPHYYVSALKEYHTGSRANFEVRKAEFINLAIMNSTWLVYIISNRDLGKWTVGGQCIDYSHAIKYLNHALQYVRRREAEEMALIDAVIPGTTARHQDWPILLTEWKETTNIHQLNSYQAKRFCKWLSGRGNGGEQGDGT